MRVRRAAIVVIMAIAGARSAASQQPAQQPDPHTVQPERPTVATHAGTVAAGWLEIETGLEHDRISSASSLLFPTVFKFGIAPRAQLSVFSPITRPAGSSLGLGDLGVGIKWRLVEDAPLVGDFAVLPSVKFPTGSTSDGRGTGTTDVSLLAISSHQFGDVAMDLNAGYTRRSGDGSAAPMNATVWTASFGGPLAKPLGWVAELYGYPSTTGPAGQASIVALLAGPTYSARDWLVLDAGIIVPISGPQPRAIYAGAVYNVGRLW